MIKWIPVIALCCFCCLAAAQSRTGNSSPKNEPVKVQPIYFLQMEGLIYTGSSKAKATITVYRDSTIFLNTESQKRSGKCSFALPLDQVFIIEISKEGYVSKKIKVNTKIPDARKRKNLEFRFEADIFESIQGLNVSVLQKPVAEVKYSDLFDSFIYDVEYTSKVNKDLKKLYQDYYLLQKTTEPETIVTPVTPDNNKSKEK